MIRYAGKPITEVVFWHEEEIIEMPAWKLKVQKTSASQSHNETEKLILQQ